MFRFGRVVFMVTIVVFQFLLVLVHSQWPICNEINECQGTVLSCNNCKAKCLAHDACEDSTVTCLSNTSCQLLCDANDACQRLTYIFESFSNGNITCLDTTGFYSCEDTNITLLSNNEIYIDCSGNTSSNKMCERMEVNVYNSNGKFIFSSTKFITTFVICNFNIFYSNNKLFS